MINNNTHTHARTHMHVLLSSNEVWGLAYLYHQYIDKDTPVPDFLLRMRTVYKFNAKIEGFVLTCNFAHAHILSKVSPSSFQASHLSASNAPFSYAYGSCTKREKGIRTFAPM